MRIEEIETKLLKEYWMLYTDWIPMSGKKLRFKKKIDWNKRKMARWIILKSYEAGLEIANNIIKGR